MDSLFRFVIRRQSPRSWKCASPGRNFWPRCRATVATAGLDWAVAPTKLMGASAALQLSAGCCFYGLSRLPEALKESSTWSGLPVAYLFFAQVLAYGFALAVLTYAATRSRWALWLALLGPLFYLDRIFLACDPGSTVGCSFFLCLWLRFCMEISLS